jgi:threonine dehydrogenase-like Zn-dependent dehydrogenase
MKSLVFLGPGRLEIEDGAPPVPEPGEVLCRVVSAGICGSELEAFHGSSDKRRPPLVLGHELVVEVVDSALSGQFVVNPLTTCGVCEQCLRGETYLCPQRRLMSLHRDGGQAEFVRVPLTDLIPWHGQSAVLGALVEPAATALHALDIPGGVRGRSVTVIGCGAIGLLAVYLARQSRAASVAAFDPLESRMAMALNEGATQADPTGGGELADVVIDTVGTQRSRASSVALCKPGGIVRFVGLRDSESALPFGDIIGRGLHLTGIYAYTRAHLERAAAILGRGDLDPRPFVKTMPLDDGAEAFRLLTDAPEQFVKIVLIP